MQHSIYLACGDKAISQTVTRLLAHNGYPIEQTTENVVQFVRDLRQKQIHLLLLDYSLQGLGSFENIEALLDEDVPVIVFANTWSDSFSLLSRSGKMIFWVAKPVHDYNLIPTVEVALAASQRIIRLKNEIENLKSKMESRRLVEKAKGILMKSLNISEEEAFRKIQKQSMNQSMTMKAVAEAIIRSYKLFS